MPIRHCIDTRSPVYRARYLGSVVVDKDTPTPDEMVVEAAKRLADQRDPARVFIVVSRVDIKVGRHTDGVHRLPLHGRRWQDHHLRFQRLL